MPNASYFSRTYTEARQKFTGICSKQAQFQCDFTLPHARGPSGEPLAIDVARFGPEDADTILLCVSGTHGAEGFPGSAVQSAWLEANRDFLSLGLPQGVALWFVHAVNPFGFAWMYRNNENNVDLNRNWIDFGQALPDARDFADIYELATPATMDPAARAQRLADFYRLVELRGEPWLESTLSRGQYDYADAPGFGGCEPQFSRLALTALVHSHMREAKRVAYVDLHSGTPGPGELIFLCFAEPGSAAFQRAASWWGADKLDADNVDRQWGGKRPERNGLMYWGLERAFGEAVDFAGAVVEFGTVDVGDRVTVLESLLIEHYLRFRADYRAAESRPWIEAMRRCFDRTGDRVWEKQVLERGRAAIDAALRGTIAWRTEISA
ncbi:MAG: DUF2817 domain-containing protein [Pseudomonadota bacterium]